MGANGFPRYGNEFGRYITMQTGRGESERHDRFNRIRHRHVGSMLSAALVPDRRSTCRRCALPQPHTTNTPLDSHVLYRIRLAIPTRPFVEVCSCVPKIFTRKILLFELFVWRTIPILGGCVRLLVEPPKPRPLRADAYSVPRREEGEGGQHHLLTFETNLHL